VYLGRIVEMAPKAELFRNPKHYYTQALLSAIPVPNPRYRKKGKIMFPRDVDSTPGVLMLCLFAGRRRRLPFSKRAISAEFISKA